MSEMQTLLTECLEKRGCSKEITGKKHLERTDCIIEFATSQYKFIFSPAEAADIMQVMRLYGDEDTQQKKAVGK